MNAMEINFRSAGWPSRGTALLLLLVMLQAMAMLAQRSAAQELWYSVTEQQAAGTVVGNLRTNLSAITKYDVSSSSNVNFHSIAQNSAPLFSINASSGIIQTTKVIDRDLVCPGQATCNVKYDVIVSPLPIVHTVMLKVFIAIIDINDNAPMFPERRVSFQIPESTPVGASFVIRGAYDADGPTFNVQRYALINDQGKFALVAPFTSSSDVKLVLTSALDAESADAYRMTLAAYDCEDQGDDDVIASPAALCHADSIAIDVTVVDVNDNIPVFDETSYTARIREDARLGTSVLRIRAVDNDQGRNALVSYRISSTPAPDASRTFYINNETHADGNAVDVILSSPLSYVDAPVHTFTVTACDFGVPRLCNDAKVTVTVVPVNRRTLVITVNTVSAADVDKMTLREDAAVGAFVAQVMATAEDSPDGASVTCSLVDSSYFQLVGAEGEYGIIIAQSLPRHTSEQLQLPIQILCRDNSSAAAAGGGKASAADATALVSSKVVYVTLLHVNEAPYFTKSLFVAHITENNAPGVSVLTLQAGDVDSGDDGIVRFVLPDAVATYFAVDQTSGVISARVPLNAEATSLFLFNVSVVDLGSPPLSAQATVVVTVGDVNDEWPVFAQKKYLFVVSDNATRGHFVGSIRAVDRDISSANSNVSYVISSDSSVPFVVDAFSGNLTVSKPMRGVSINALAAYSFVVKATDVNNARFVDTASVVIVIEDGVDRNPRFVFPTAANNTVHIAAQTPENHIIATLSAISHDSTVTNERLVYSIVRGNEDGVFAVNSLTGALYIAAPLAAKVNVSTYTFTVEVMDSVITSRRSQCVMHVIVNTTIAFTAVSQQQIVRPLGQNVILLICVGVGVGMFLVIAIILVAILLRHWSRGRHRRSIIIKHGIDVSKSSFSRDVTEETLTSQTALFLTDDRAAGGSFDYRYNGGFKAANGCQPAAAIGSCKKCSCTRNNPLTSVREAVAREGRRTSRTSLDTITEVSPPLLSSYEQEQHQHQQQHGYGRENNESPDGSTADSGRGNSEPERDTATASFAPHLLNDKRLSPDLAYSYSTSTQLVSCLKPSSRVNTRPLLPSHMAVESMLPFVDEDRAPSPSGSSVTSDMSLAVGSSRHPHPSTLRYNTSHRATPVARELASSSVTTV